MLTHTEFHSKKISFVCSNVYQSYLENAKYLGKFEVPIDYETVSFCYENGKCNEYDTEEFFKKTQDYERIDKDDSSTVFYNEDTFYVYQLPIKDIVLSWDELLRKTELVWDTELKLDRYAIQITSNPYQTMRNRNSCLYLAQEFYSSELNVSMNCEGKLNILLNSTHRYNNDNLSSIPGKIETITLDIEKSRTLYDTIKKHCLKIISENNAVSIITEMKSTEINDPNYAVMNNKINLANFDNIEMPNFLNGIIKKQVSYTCNGVNHYSYNDSAKLFIERFLIHYIHDNNFKNKVIGSYTVFIEYKKENTTNIEYIKICHTQEEINQLKNTILPTLSNKINKNITTNILAFKILNF